MGTLNKIGFFNFGEKAKDKPLDSLQNELSKHPGLSDCLLVLPEAFNVKGGYLSYQKGECADPSVCAELQNISTGLGVVFVAGLIDPEGCNSAILIDGAYCRVLSRKDCQFDEPIAHRGLRIAALVCNEADYSGGNSRRERRRDKVLNAIEALPAGPIVLCVPACLSHPIAEKVVRLWEEPDAMVIANSHLQCASVIRIKPNTPEPLQRNDSGHWGFNVIELCTLGKIV